MAKDFHNEPFDEETILKLEIFRGYIREWVPVFLSKRIFNCIYIFDFFAGPGKDSNDQKGSPLIIIDELKKYFEHHISPAVPNIAIKLIFNDVDHDKIDSLQKELCNEDAFAIETTSLSFEQSFAAQRDNLRSKSAVKLVILDQCGVKQITGDVFKQLIDSPFTDFMFFISSSHLRRFISTGEFKKYFPEMLPAEIKNVPATDVHRFVCQYYQKLVPSDKQYYIAPFSIKKGSNIYGIIFGSGILLGLDKFLKVCWNQDSVSGEANYDIDDDMVRQGKTLFERLNISKKIDFVQEQLVDYLHVFRSNNELYKFTLENGCLPTHTVDVLKRLQKNGRLETKPSDTRKSSFYLNWRHYRNQEVKAKYRIKK